MGRTSLTRYAPLMRDPQETDARREARETYLETEGQTILINKKWLPNWADMKLLDQLAVKALGVKGEGK